MPKVSLIVLTFNEGLNLRKCLKSAEGLVSEIIIVDSGSTDDTPKIAEEFKAKVFRHDFKNQAETFNWALQNTNPSGEWIMRLDADEEILPELKKEIEEKLPGIPADVGGVILRRRTYFSGTWMRHGGIYPTLLLRIFRNGKGMSEEREMDEHLILKEGSAVTFENDFIDNNLNPLGVWIAKHRNYAKREARAYLAQPTTKGTNDALTGGVGRKYRLKMEVYYRTPPFLRVALYFLYRYIFLCGFLDGATGLLFHFLQGFWYRWLVDVEILKLRRKSQ
ncbi:MAG: glycosyltransferase family 2 protein [Candidatus Liptonbacteria bacterium]|nr:glycosyltransferase family 2 protein [Candidatus Liptonbacteria bacterium]